ncbi:DUF3159 domain-containing protein [Nonomuraea sp. NPDC050022]|uniref:DUF3159 domain-containing protein n=1 Tax=Nonomuraea sp. NPDC050022 TaxID=3364358 RepID=UPI0037A41ED7
MRRPGPAGGRAGGARLVRCGGCAAGRTCWPAEAPRPSSARGRKWPARGGPRRRAAARPRGGSELVLNAAGLVACAVSLLIGRPLTEAVCRKAGTEPSRTAGDPAARRRHVRLTAGWAVLWVSHLVPLGYLYAANSLVGLTLVSALFSKPSLPAMAAFTVVVVRRAARRGLYATAAAPRSSSGDCHARKPL